MRTPMLPFRADRVALEGVDPDPIPLGFIEFQRRHHFLEARELMVMVQLDAHVGAAP